MKKDISIFTKLHILFTVRCHKQSSKKEEELNYYLAELLQDAESIYEDPDNPFRIIVKAKKSKAILWNGNKYYAFLSDGSIDHPHYNINWVNLCPSKKMIIKFLQKKLELEQRFMQEKLE